jgi:hypothetical protein
MSKLGFSEIYARARGWTAALAFALVVGALVVGFVLHRPLGPGGGPRAGEPDASGSGGTAALDGAATDTGPTDARS